MVDLAPLHTPSTFHKRPETISRRHDVSPDQGRKDDGQRQYFVETYGLRRPAPSPIQLLYPCTGFLSSRRLMSQGFRRRLLQRPTAPGSMAPPPRHCISYIRITERHVYRATDASNLFDTSL